VSGIGCLFLNGRQPLFPFCPENEFPKYDISGYNFAVNPAKAVQVAKKLLLP
jgi:hypothetical protein